MLSKKKLSFLLLFPYYFLLGVLLQHQSFAQAPASYIAKEGQEMGKLRVENYLPSTYKGGPWVRGLTRDEQGLIYFASSNEPIVHTFDGTHFNKIKISNLDSRINSILVAKDTMWLGSGGQKGIGFVTKDKNGQFNGSHYFSIRELLPDTITYNGVYSIKQINNKTYFLLQEKGLVRWSSGKITTWEIPDVYRQMFTYKNKLYIPARLKIHTLENDSISVLHNWNGGTLRGLTLYDSKNALAISTGKVQFSLFDGQQYTPVFQQLPYIKNVLNAMTIDGNYFLIGSLSQGLFIINKKGKLITRINKENGLSSNTTINMIKAVDHTIWVETYHGLSQFQFPDPITIFGGTNVLGDYAKGIVRYKDNLFIGNKTGVYKLEKAKDYNSSARFSPVRGADWWVRSMFKTKNGILIGTNGFGLYFFKDEVLTKINCPREYRILDIHQMRKVPNLYLMKAMGSLHLMEYKHNVFNHLGKIMNMSGEYPIEEDRFGNIFISSHKDKNVRKLQLQDLYKSTNEFTEALLQGHFDIKVYENNLAVGRIDEVIVSMGSKGLNEKRELEYHNDELDSFLPFKKFQYEYKNNEPFRIWLTQAANGDVYTTHPIASPIVYGDSTSKSTLTERLYVRAIKLPDGSYKWDNQPFQSISQDLVSTTSIYPEDDGVIWFCNSSGEIVRYDPNLRKDTSNSITAYISSIKTIKTDSTILQSYAQSRNSRLDIPFKENSLRLNYVALSFTEPDSIYYRYQLKGFDKTWSPWTHETRKDYTGLEPGSYNFKVQAVHPLLQSSDTTTMQFYILPPWYRTWWAYLLYVLLGCTLLYGLLKIRIRQIEKDKKKLENLVHERTLQLEEQAEHLKELDVIKNRFFANISHEFRTPLTLILGPLYKMYQGNFKGNRKPIYGMMMRNAKRLQRLINDLLDLSKLESGKLKIHVSKVDINEQLKMILANYTSLAESKNVQYQFEPNVNSLNVYIDVKKIEKVFYNLLSNAFKFTGRGGKIKVALNKVIESDKPYAEIFIIDSGIGIPGRQLSLIFDRFHRVDSTNYETEGTGIGLAIVKEFVELHHGTITVISKEGQGTSFRVLLPLGKKHFNSNQLIDKNTGMKRQPTIEADEQLIVSNSIPQSFKNKKPHILIVEDNADMRAYIRLVLNEHYQLHEAPNGLKGWKKAIKIQPSIIISDIMMPKMDGVTMCKKIKTDWRTSHIPIILLTAKADQSSRLKGLESRADDYIIKPFNEQELLQIVKNRILQRQELRKKWAHIVKLDPKEICITSTDEVFLKNLINVIVKHIDNANFGVEELVNDLAVSRTQLHRKVKALTNQSTTEFIRTFRLKRAHDLIIKKAGSISEIAYRVGFSSPQYFGRSFRKRFGYTPGQIGKKSNEIT